MKIFCYSCNIELIFPDLEMLWLCGIC